MAPTATPHSAAVPAAPTSLHARAVISVPSTSALICSHTAEVAPPPGGTHRADAAGILLQNGEVLPDLKGRALHQRLVYSGAVGFQRQAEDGGLGLRIHVGGRRPGKVGQHQQPGRLRGHAAVQQGIDILPVRGRFGRLSSGKGIPEPLQCGAAGKGKGIAGVAPAGVRHHRVALRVQCRFLRAPGQTAPGMHSTVPGAVHGLVAGKHAAAQHGGHLVVAAADNGNGVVDAQLPGKLRPQGAGRRTGRHRL